ncbi:TonB-dependent receptor [Fulvivirga ulvae]|uniref:SusC/RagA family TonB-linked outer membrane protein n=1 Tax=Fulvivirga ulvae TaxID=2904245 RepID=UPI001F3CFD80|nr:TonB-dependent receptor [Fulvivirga ulvae]UII32294.1 TonB-dependent receptor [Fulvivirga ulvae]
MLNLYLRKLSKGRIMLLALLCFYGQTALAQNQVSGTVLDSNKEPLPGVTILEKGTTNGTASDANGDFQLTVSDNATLIFSFIGFSPKEVPVNGQTAISIELEEDISMLGEVVVIGYGEIDKSRVTTSIASLDQEKIQNLPLAGVDQAIQGRLAGVSVSSNGGQPGGGVSVRIRGLTSVNGNEPLYVIDGVPVAAESTSLNQNFLGGGDGQTTQSVLATLNPSDIESIDVLKDASAQAIYGSRAANGVVLITTKKGRIGEGKLTFNTYYGVQAIPKKLDVLNLQEYARYQNTVTAEINEVTGGSMPINPEFADPSILGHGTDWQDEIYQRGNVQSNVLALSGGQNKTNYYFSLGQFNQTGILAGTDFERYSMRASADSDLKDWLTAGFSVNASRSNQRIGLTDAFDAVTSVVLYNSPAAPVRDVNGDYVGQIRVGNSLVGNQSNPVAVANLRDVRSINTRIIGSVYGEVKFLEGLSLRNELNYDYTLADGKAYQPFVENEALNVSIISPSKLREQRNQSLYYVLKNYLTYARSFDDAHHIYVTLGHEAQHSEFDYLQASRENLTLNLPSLAAGDGGNDSGETINAGAGEWAMESYFGRLNYSYKDKYALSATLRADGSSSFGSNNRWGYFPAVSAAWTITNEPFASDLPFVNSLKLRAGYGAVGNQNTAANLYTANVTLVNISAFGNGSVPSNVPNPDLGWESVVTYNAGIDASLLDRKIDLTVDVYRKISTDMLLNTQLGAYSGLGTEWDDIKTPVTNDGQITNNGIDISVTSKNISNPNLTWSTTAVFSHYKNELDFLNTSDAAIKGEFDEYGTKSLVAYTQAGYPVGVFYGYVTDGLYTSEEELNSLETGLDVKPDGLWFGDIKYKDLNGNGIIDDKDVEVIGDPNPDFTLGLTNTVSYKGIDLTVFVYGSFGGDIFNYTRRQTEAMNSLYSNQATSVLDRYTADNTDTDMPRYNQWHDNNRRISDRYIEDGTYVRLQNVQLGYNFPKALISKAKISALKLYVSGQNLVTFTDYSGYDPELGKISDQATSSRGILLNVDNGRYPVPRSYTVGLNIEF